MKKNGFFKFIGYKAERIDFCINRKFSGHDEENHKLSMSIDQEVAQHKQDKDSFLVALTCKVYHEEHQLSEEEYPFSLEVKLLGTFKSENVSDEERATFIEVNAPAILYPYLRSTVSHVVSLAGFTPPTLPIMNFLKDESETE